MLYNPAGLYFTDAKYGLNILGSYGVRVYCNSMSSDDLIKMLGTMAAGENLSSSGVLDKVLLNIPEVGFDIGCNISTGNIMTYFKFKKFSLGLSFIPKTYVTFLIEKSFFTTIFQSLDLTKPINFGLKATAVQYLDFNLILSTRALFLEKVIPVDAIYVGMAGHFYFPTLFAKMSSANVRLSSGTPDSETGFIDNYQLRLRGDMVVGANAGVTQIFKYISTPNSGFGSYVDDYAGSILSYAGSAAFGLGFDVGFMIKFNRFIRLGFSATDIGFIVFPQTARMSLDVTADIGLETIANFTNTFTDKMEDEFLNNNASAGAVEWWMPDTSIRIGVALTPLKNGMITIAADISITDLNRLVNGEYPTFNFSTGIELLPGYKWFAAPVRVAFNYNSQSNMPSFSFGLGLYFGPVEMEIGVKGLEFLITDWGAKEVCIGVDLKFEF